MGVGTFAGAGGEILSRKTYERVTKEQVAQWIEDETGRKVEIERIKELKSSSPALQVFTAKVKKGKKKLVCWVHLGLGEHSFSYVKM